MSLLDDLAKAIGHTVESLAQDIGADVGTVETVVNDLRSYGIDVFATAAQLRLDPVTFLRNVINLLGSDPHQIILQHLIRPIQPAQDPLYQLSQRWGQMAMLHDNTAQTINTHMNELFQGGGQFSYSGSAANMLWETHQSYQQYFTGVVIPHAQIQQTRHSTLAGHVDDYLNQMPGKIYNLSPPMAALGALGFETITSRAAAPAPTDAPPQWLTDAINWAETTEQNLDNDVEGTPPGPENPWWDFLVLCMIVVAVILLVLAIGWGIWWLWDHLTSHQNQQKNTSTPNPPAKPTPTPTLSGPLASMADDLSKQYGVPLSVVEDIMNKNPGLTKDEYALLVQYYKKYGTYPYNVVAIFTGVDQNGKSRIYFITQGDLKHIREKHIEFDALSDAELIGLIKELLQQEPDRVKRSKDGTSQAFYYEGVDIDGKYQTVVIVISTDNPGRIITAFTEDN